MGCCGAATRVQSLAGKGADPAQELPVKERSIRDVPCLIVFVIFLIGGILAASVALSRGSAHRLLHGYDNYGNVCGMDNAKIQDVPQSGQDFTDKRVLLIEDSLSPSEKGWAGLDFGLNPLHLMNRSCVAKCPDQGGEQVLNYCFYSSSGSSGGGNSSDPGAAVEEASSLLESACRDLEAAWPELVGICAIALGLSIVLLVILRFLAWLIVYIVVAIVVLGALGVTGFLWYMYVDYKSSAEEASEPVKSFRMKDANNFLCFAIVASICTVLLLIVLFIMRKRIKLVTALFKEAGRAVQAMPFLLVQPLCTFLFMSVTVAVWMGVALVIESVGTPIPGKQSGYVQFRKDDTALFFRWYNLFALFWITQFILACQDMVVGGAISKWFFTRDKSRLGSPILLAIKNLVCYHLGSVALGSFIIAVVKLIRYLLKKLQSRMGKNPVVKAICCCAQCCIWCLEKFLQFLNRNAYVEITIHGYNFCKAAQEAFSILAQNALRVAAINSIGTFVLFLGKAAVTVSTVFIAMEIMEGRPDIKHPYVFVAIGGVFAYIISYVFISIYEMAIDALFICFCEDCQLNDGINRPYYMSKGLMELVNNSKKALAALKYKTDSPEEQPQAMFKPSPNAPQQAMPQVY